MKLNKEQFKSIIIQNVEPVMLESNLHGLFGMPLEKCTSDFAEALISCFAFSSANDIDLESHCLTAFLEAFGGKSGDVDLMADLETKMPSLLSDCLRESLENVL